MLLRCTIDWRVARHTTPTHSCVALHVRRPEGAARPTVVAQVLTMLVLDLSLTNVSVHTLPGSSLAEEDKLDLEEDIRAGRACLLKSKKSGLLTTGGGQEEAGLGM